MTQHGPRRHWNHGKQSSLRTTSGLLDVTAGNETASLTQFGPVADSLTASETEGEENVEHRYSRHPD